MHTKVASSCFSQMELAIKWALATEDFFLPVGATTAICVVVCTACVRTNHCQYSMPCGTFSDVHCSSTSTMKLHALEAAESRQAAFQRVLVRQLALMCKLNSITDSGIYWLVSVNCDQQSISFSCWVNWSHSSFGFGGMLRLSPTKHERKLCVQILSIDVYCKAAFLSLAFVQGCFVNNRCATATEPTSRLPLARILRLPCTTC